MKCFNNALVYVEGAGIKRRSIEFDEQILRICKKSKAEEIEIPFDAIVLPGFIDQHVHGAGGSDGMDGTTKDISIIANILAKEGTTSFLATTMTNSNENILKSLTAVKDYIKSDNRDGARLLGVHLEGPFISSAHKGAQPEESVQEPDIKTFDEYNIASGNSIKVVTLAPEKKGADKLIRYLKENGVVASIGHSGAKYEDVENAVLNGAKSVTHTFNAQTGLHHREVGVVGSAMLIDDLNCELIADTIHVSVPAMKLLVKNKPSDKITLITDAMRAKGMPDGESELGGQKVFVKNGEARLVDGTLAGSVLTMNKAVENMVNKVGVEFLKAVDYATINPAKNLGLDDKIGGIKVGKKADFTVIDKDFNVLLTVRDGKIIYKA